jgi:signal peptidase I
MAPEKTSSTGADASGETAPASVKTRATREIVAWAWIVGIFLLVNGTIAQARVIPSGSMENTMLVGDHLIMSRVGYDAGVPFTPWHFSLWRTPKRGQIVIFRSLEVPGTDLVKRFIGMPGDTVEVKDGAVWVNGAKLNEPYIKEPMNRVEHFGPLVVPPDHYFAMGDNRNDSYDSRYFGPVPRANVIGVPLINYLSVVAPTTNAWEPGHLGERFEAYGDAIIHPSRIRWRRLFRPY